MKDITLKEIADLLDKVATATYLDKRKIEGNLSLEKQRAEDAMTLEDILANKMDCFGIGYVRKYDYLYKHLKK